MSIKQPSDAIVAVTHRCNARCVMCNVWKSTRPDVLAPAHMRKLPAALRTVNLTGGEPFLRADLPQFVREVRRRCGAAQITISTNASEPDRIAGMMDEIRRIDPSVRLAVSLDGIGPAHDRIRGVEGFFEKAMRLIEMLRTSGFKGLRLGMTVGGGNIDQLKPLADMADKLGLELGVVAAHPAETHLAVTPADLHAIRQDPSGPFARVISRWLRTWRPKQWLRAHFAAGTYRYLVDRPWRFRCRAGGDFFFVQADGAVYHCSVCGQKLGNLATDEWDEIWSSRAADSARRFADSCPRACWMICTARGYYRANAPRIAAWILRAKLLAHLRRLRLRSPRPGGREE